MVGQLPTMDMEVFKLVVTMLVAEGRGCERERERERESERGVLLAVEMRGAGFFVDFKPKSLHTWTMKIKSIYRR